MEELCDVCPICYNSFREPKGLPCFHTFCKECLQLHINTRTNNNELYFNCPMCRNRTAPFGQMKLPVSEWASSFPTNNYILNQYAKISKKQCPNHNELLDISCKTCHVMICYQCCLGAHEKCDKTLTKSNAERIKNGLQVHLKKLKLKLEPLESRMDKLDKNREVTESEVKKLTQELLEFVGNQEKHWIKEIETSHSDECGALKEERENLVKVIEMTQENLNDIENLVGNENIEDRTKYVTTLEYQPRHALVPMITDLAQTRGAEVNFEINQVFVKLKDLLLKTNMVKTDEDDDDDDDINVNISRLIGNASAENLQPRPRPFQLVGNISLTVNLLAGINDMIAVPDHCFLITEACFKKLWKFSTVGQCLKNTAFSTEPYGLCLLQENCVAVSQPYTTKISILDCANLTEKESFNLGKRYYGLASNDYKTIYSLYRDGTMCVDIITKNGPQSSYAILQVLALPTIFYTCFDYRLRILPSGNILIITSVNSINCIDQNGVVAFSYQGDSSNKLDSISDIAVNRNYIYVADKSTNKIHRIQHTGNAVDVKDMSTYGNFQPKKLSAADEGIFAVLCKPTQNMQIQLFSS